MLRINDKIELIAGQQLNDIITALPKWRRDVVMRYKFEGGRRESALAFALLYDMLQEYLPEPFCKRMADVPEFIIGEHGKPELQGLDGVHFNLSHCKHAVACVVDSEPVGVDVECLGRYSEGVARYTLSDAELQQLYHNPDGTPRTDEDIDLQFTILWTRKEALLKYLGTGITDDLKTILHHYEGKVAFDTIVNREKRYVCTQVKPLLTF